MAGNHAIIAHLAKPNNFTNNHLARRPPHPIQHRRDGILARGYSRAIYPAGLSVWLLDAGSLTQRLRHICAGRFGVRVLSQRWTRPGRDEAAALRLRLDAWAWTREVQLLCDGNLGCSPAP